MYTLYIANKNYSSWSLRPWVLMQVLNIPFEEVLTPFGATEDPRGFRAFSPSGKVPCLVDGDTRLWDSLAITEYLAEAVPDVWPAETRARAWARCATAEMHSGFSQIRDLCTMNCGLRVRIETYPEPLRAEWVRVSELWCEGLSRFGGPYLAGDRFTAVDAFFAPVAFRVQTYAPPIDERAREYAQRLLDLPAMEAWYQAALDETWREEGHEAEARAAGTLLKDLRR